MSFPSWYLPYARVFSEHDTGIPDETTVPSDIDPRIVIRFAPAAHAHVKQRVIPEFR
jgi:hypothetical protein